MRYDAPQELKAILSTTLFPGSLVFPCHGSLTPGKGSWQTMGTCLVQQYAINLQWLVTWLLVVKLNLGLDEFQKLKDHNLLTIVEMEIIREIPQWSRLLAIITGAYKVKRKAWRTRERIFSLLASHSSLMLVFFTLSSITKCPSCRLKISIIKHQKKKL